jgi:hypothetical protein
MWYHRVWYVEVIKNISTCISYYIVLHPGGPQSYNFLCCYWCSRVELLLCIQTWNLIQASYILFLLPHTHSNLKQLFNFSVLKNREYTVKINFLFHYDTKSMNLELLVIATKLDKPRQVLISINDKTRSNAQYVKITVVWKSLCHFCLIPQDIWMLKITNE